MRSMLNTSELRTIVHVLQRSSGCSHFYEALETLSRWLNGNPKLPEMEFIDDEFLDRGPVYKQPLCDNGPYTFSVLFLPPSAAISEHLHDTDQEDYIILDWDKKQWVQIQHCPIGETHSLCNRTEKEMIVLSIKERP